MSYILDALKKSEQERQGTAGPSVHTIHSAAPKQSANHSMLLVLASICIVSISSAAFFYFKSTTTNPAPVIAQPEPAIIDKPAPTPAASTTSVEQQTIPQAKPKEILEFWQLPDPIQSEIPSLTFSFHVYSESPEKRTIIINKIRLKEGGKPLPNLVLEEITKEGVILNWKQQYLFYIPVVESW